MRIATVVLLCLVTPVGAQDEGTTHDLRLAFTPGTVLHYHCLQGHRITVEGGIRRSVETEQWYTLTARGPVEKGQQTIELRFQRMKQTTKQGETTSVQDTKDETYPGGAAMLEPILFVLDARGRMVKVTAFAGYELAKLPEANRGELTRGARSLIEVLALAGLGSLPEAPLAIGGTWKTKTRAPLVDGREVQAVVTARLAEVKGSTAHIKQSWAYDISGEGGFKLSEAKVTGGASLDLSTGSILSFELLTTMVGVGRGKRIDARSTAKARLVKTTQADAKPR